MVVRLVAMRILADETRNVGRRVVGQGRGAVEQRVELFLKRRIAAEMVDQPIDVMLVEEGRLPAVRFGIVAPLARIMPDLDRIIILPPAAVLEARARERSEEHTSELQSLMRTSYAVFCLKKKKENNN